MRYLLYSKTMMKWFILLVLSLSGITSLSALEVQLNPQKVYMGDTFTVSVSDTQAIQNATFTFSPTVQMVGQQTMMQSINGRSSYRYIASFQATTDQKEIVLTGVTVNGKPLSLTGTYRIAVQQLTPDEAVSLTMTSTSETLLIGDVVDVTIDLRVPYVKDGRGEILPFMETAFFGQLNRVAPKLQFSAQPVEDASVQLLTQRYEVQIKEEASNLLYRTTFRYQAVREGETHLPSPVLNDERIEAVKGERLVTKRCFAMGKPLVLTVVPPPQEGRPASFMGAIATTFSAEAALDTLNAKQGDPLELTVFFKTDGPTEGIFPPVLPQMDGFRFAGEPTREKLAEGVRYTFHFRPLVAGLLEIPAIPYGWYDRQAKVYREGQIGAIPLRVLPSAQLVLVGENGAALTQTLPSALFVTPGNTLHLTPKPWAMITLLVGLVALLLRWSYHLIARVLHRLLKPFRRRRPAKVAIAAIQAATTPEAALAAVRVWLQKPAVTANDLSRYLPPCEAREPFIEAYRTLETALYTQGQDVPEARAVLIQHLPTLQVARRKRYHKRSSTTALTILLLLGVGLCPKRVTADDFLRQQAESSAIAATTTNGYAEATNFYLRLLREGDFCEANYLNGASCAFFAKRPRTGLQLITQYERRFGRTTVSQKTMAALCDRLGEPMPLIPATAWSLEQWQNVALAALGVALFVLACYRKTRGYKLVSYLVWSITCVLLLIAGTKRLRCTLSEVPEPIEIEAEADE